MRLIACIAIILLLLVQVAGAANINPERDLVYLGAFRVPYSPLWKGHYDAMSYGQFGLAYNPAGNSGAGSLFITSHSQLWGVAEISLATPVNDSANGNRLSALNTCSILQGFIDPTLDSGGNSRVNFTWTSGSGRIDLNAIAVLPAHGSQTTNKLYWSFMNYFAEDSLTETQKTTGWSELDLTNYTSLASAGTWRTLDASTSTNVPTGEYMFEIPTTWADSNVSNKYLATGRFRVTGGTFGPPIYAMAPWASGNPPADNTALSLTTLLKYPRGHVPTGYNHSMADKWHGGAWLEGPNSKTAVIIAGTKCFREATTGANEGTANSNHLEYYDNGTAANYMLPESPSTGHGYHAEPYMPGVLFYSPDDLASVAAGTKQAYEPQPYAIWYPNKYMYHKDRPVTEILGGVAYDRTNRKLYIAEPMADNVTDPYSPTPVIHVWQIGDNGGTQDTTSPSTPSNLSFNAGTKTLSWTASTAGTKKLYYIIYRKVGAHGSSPGGYEPVAMAQSNSWVDSWYSDYAAANNSTNNAVLADGSSRGSGAYKVMAMDELGNKSTLSDIDGSTSVVNGACGTSNGQSFASAPTTNLCSTGTASSVSGSGPWSWSCAGSGGGSTANCSAALATAPVHAISIKLGSGKITGMMK